MGGGGGGADWGPLPPPAAKCGISKSKKCAAQVCSVSFEQSRDIIYRVASLPVILCRIINNINDHRIEMLNNFY